MNNDLFGEEINQLRVLKNKTSVQSKKQKEFNKLCKEIEEIKAETDKAKLDLEDAFQLFNLKVAPTFIEHDKHLFEFVKAVDKHNLATNFSESFNAKIYECICDILEEISVNFKDEKMFDELMQKYNDKTAKQHEEEVLGDAKEELEFMLKSMGLDIDLTNIDDSPEGMKKIQELLKEQIEAKESKQSNRKKTAKQIEKEEAKKNLEDIQSKSIRTIYVSLAKALHPDLEPNEDEKLFKEELLKKVTEAYEKKDLAALLSYEMQWVKNESQHSSTLSDEQLTIYNKILKETKQSLIDELYMTVDNPKYRNVKEFVVDESDYKSQILDSASIGERKISELKNTIINIENGKSLKPFKKFIEEYYEEMYDDFPFPFEM